MSPGKRRSPKAKAKQGATKAEAKKQSGFDCDKCDYSTRTFAALYSHKKRVHTEAEVTIQYLLSFVSGSRFPGRNRIHGIHN